MPLCLFLNCQCVFSLYLLPAVIILLYQIDGVRVIDRLSACNVTHALCMLGIKIDGHCLEQIYHGCADLNFVK